MQDYIEIASKNGVTLADEGECQFCDAKTKRGVHECMEIFNLGFQSIDYNDPENHMYRFFIVDAHTLQHPEIHGRWSNHFHLARLHLIFKYNVAWSYKLSPKLSDSLNQYKEQKQNEYLVSPEPLKRGTITSTDVLEVAQDEIKCKSMIRSWAMDVYEAWNTNLETINPIAQMFLDENSNSIY